MFSKQGIKPEQLAADLARLMPEYLPGVDTGAFEPTDRRRCWNKSLKNMLSVLGKNGFEVQLQPAAYARANDQLVVFWVRENASALMVTTGWGDRAELELSLQWLLSFKSPQKLLIYTCNKWHDAVLDQIRAALLRYPYHNEGEQYLFMNLLGAENRFHLFSSEPYLAPEASILRAVAGSPFKWSVK